MTSLVVGYALIALVVIGLLAFLVLCYGWRETLIGLGLCVIIGILFFSGLTLVERGMSIVGNTLGNTIEKIDTKDVASERE